MRNLFRWLGQLRTERQPISQEELGLLARQLGFPEKEARAFLRRLSVDQRASTLADLRQLEEAKNQLSRSPGGGIFGGML